MYIFIYMIHLAQLSPAPLSFTLNNPQTGAWIPTAPVFHIAPLGNPYLLLLFRAYTAGFSEVLAFVSGWSQGSCVGRRGNCHGWYDVHAHNTHTTHTHTLFLSLALDHTHIYT